MQCRKGSKGLLQKQRCRSLEVEEQPQKEFPEKQGPAEVACVLHTDYRAVDGCLSTKDIDSMSGRP